MKYCRTCDIYRPPRAIHCGYCDCCIERLDHHCPWLGTCIGKRNYKYFMVFIWLVALHSCQCIVISVFHVTESSFRLDGGFSRAQKISLGNLSLISFLSLFVFYLLGYHQYLICRNETTNENLKGSYNKLGNPFDRGCVDNIRRLYKRDKRNWKPEWSVYKEEEKNQPYLRRNSIPRKVKKTTNLSSSAKNTQGQNSSFKSEIKSQCTPNANREREIVLSE